MPRLFPTLLALALLGGSAAAFAISEHLKLEKSPIRGPLIERVFSPGCACPHPSAALTFRLPHRDTLTIEVLDGDGHVVRTLTDHSSKPRGRVTFHWNGRSGAGVRVPDGPYRYRVRLGSEGRTIVLPFPVLVDTTPPRVTIVSAIPRVLRAGIDGHSGRVKLRYRMSERAVPVVLADGKPAVRGLRQRRFGQLDWYARRNGKALPPGAYRLTIVARDPAGNRSRPAPAVMVRIRPRRAAAKR